MLSVLAEKISDNRFLGLMRTALQTGYLEDWTWNATLTEGSARRHGIARPFEYYMHRLDIFVDDMEKVLIPVGAVTPTVRPVSCL